MEMSYLIIVLNGKPFIDYNLKSIYPFAKEIIIVEGSIPSFEDFANHDGSSKDGTIRAIKKYPDPENKIKLIQGKWHSKVQMQNEGLKQVTGSYVWFVDVDEFYKQNDIRRVFKILTENPSIDQVWFKAVHFFKGLDYYMFHPTLLKKVWLVRRIFKCFPGIRLRSHRPPKANLKLKPNLWKIGKVWTPKNILLYHYGYLYDSQVRAKLKIHKDKFFNSIHPDEWYENLFIKWNPSNRRLLEKKYPVWILKKNSKTKKFEGVHPNIVKEMYSANPR